MNEDLTKELYEALKETMDSIKSAFGNSGYYQFTEYAAKENGTINWYSKSIAALKKYEKLNNIHQ